MLYLVSTRIVKLIRGEVMDEELFRSYFVKLYRKMVQMEVSFLNLLEDEDKDGFVLYSKSLRELAGLFKTFRDPSNVIQGAFSRKINKDGTRDELTYKLLFGLGQLPVTESKSCKILPLGFGGLYRAAVQEEQLKERKKEMEDQANEDLIEEKAMEIA